MNMSNLLKILFNYKKKLSILENCENYKMSINSSLENIKNKSKNNCVLKKKTTGIVELIKPSQSTKFFHINESQLQENKSNNGFSLKLSESKINQNNNNIVYNDKHLNEFNENTDYCINEKSINIDNNCNNYSWDAISMKDMNILSRRFLDDIEYCNRVRNKDLNSLSAIFLGKHEKTSKQAENISFRRHTFNYIIAELHSKIVKEICIKSENDEIFKITYKALMKILDIVKGNTDMDKRIFFINHDMRVTLSKVIKHVLVILKEMKTDEAKFGVICYKRVLKIISQVEYNKKPIDILNSLTIELEALGVKNNEVLADELNKLNSLKDLRVERAWENKKIQSIKSILMIFKEFVDAQKAKNNFKNLNLDLKENLEEKEESIDEYKTKKEETLDDIFKPAKKEKLFSISKIYDREELELETEIEEDNDFYKIFNSKSSYSTSNEIDLNFLIKQYSNYSNSKKNCISKNVSKAVEITEDHKKNSSFSSKVSINNDENRNKVINEPSNDNPCLFIKKPSSKYDLWEFNKNESSLTTNGEKINKNENNEDPNYNPKLLNMSFSHSNPLSSSSKSDFQQITEKN